MVVLSYNKGMITEVKQGSARALIPAFLPRQSFWTLFGESSPGEKALSAIAELKRLNPDYEVIFRLSVEDLLHIRFAVRDRALAKRKKGGAVLCDISANVSVESFGVISEAIFREADRLNQRPTNHLNKDK